MRRWGWAAAAALVLVATGAWFWLASRASLKIAKEQGSSLQHNDLAPGKTGAILKLADGSAISLDSLNNGVVANEQGTRIVLENGRLAYDADSAERVGYNNIITPNGRQFRLVLPDGTKVWLNAASSLRYPTVFKGSERLVELSGEAYFEISRDAKMPFRVKINEATRIQVLGTSFNVNAYSDEPAIKATLVDGSVKVVTDGSGLSDVVLKPGQQVEIRDGKMQTRQANIDQVLAWKNNEFHFSDDDLGSVMRQIARWYDVKIVYEGADRSLRFGGVISKGENVSVVLNKLEQIGIVKFRIENKTIYVK
jgi:ferric-dicitrate binding protein FerR (iron transport regulator)